MTVLELMERAGIQNETLAIAYIKDAIHLIQSNTKEKIEVSKRDLIKSSGSTDNVYILPADLVSLENISLTFSKTYSFNHILFTPHSSILNIPL